MTTVATINRLVTMEFVEHSSTHLVARENREQRFVSHSETKGGTLCSLATQAPRQTTTRVSPARPSQKGFDDSRFILGKGE
ncbi:unnamed protein product [Cuscuta campestris]|uniref:Uncharacterized protein n=1 Tax=Cuscuta campestris TaxID=132261 RepID=A0A484MMP2_9ASTE|nr:unnamed protein product [Cuscuta campestris]